MTLFNVISDEIYKDLIPVQTVGAYLTSFTVFFSGNIYTQQKKLPVRKSQKTMQHKNIKENNYSFFICLFRYMSSNKKNIYFSLLAPIPLLWHCVSSPGVKSIFRKIDYRVPLHIHIKSM